MKPRATYANLVSTLALVLALSGTAIAAQGLITGKDVKNGSLAGKDLRKDTVTGKQVKESSLTTVPDAQKLGGAPASAYLKGGLDLHVVDTPGEPALAGSWNPGDPAPAFWKDSAGIVHLRGNVLDGTGTDGLLFTLPAGFRPASPYADFVVASTVSKFNTLSINSNGEVYWYLGDGVASYMSLEGVSFLAEN